MNARWRREDANAVFDEETITIVRLGKTRICDCHSTYEKMQCAATYETDSRKRKSLL